MHFPIILSLSLSLVGSSLAQLAGNVAPPRPGPAVSVNVGGQNAQQQPGVAPTPVGQQPQQQPQPPGVAGAAPAAITIRPAGQGNQGQAGLAVPQQPQQPQQPQAGAVPGQVPALGQQAGAAQPVWIIKVGSERNELVFSPNTLSAKPGDLVQFQFYSRNHSVVSSTFDQPCAPDVNTAPQRAFFSGFMPTDQQGQITYTVAVKDTEPMWFYCSQGRHCQDGMVGVINPPQNGQQTLQQYQTNAQRAADNVSPNGQPGSQPGGGIAGTQTNPGIAQATRSAGTILQRASWELAGAAIVVWAML